MKKLFLFGVFSLFSVFSLFGGALAAPDPKPDPKPDPHWRNYRLFNGGDWTALYPATWKVRPGALKSDPNSENRPAPKSYDLVFFTSPDHRARFSIHYPKWNLGSKPMPAGIGFDPKREKQLSKKVTAFYQGTEPDERAKIETRWIFVRARDGSYSRWIVDIENLRFDMRHTLSFRYQNGATFRKYLPQFQKLKASMELEIIQ